MRITVLTYLEEEGSKEHDIVVDQVADALREGGHEPTILGVHADLKKLLGGLEKQKPELIFNLLEMFGKSISADIAVAGLLDLLGLRYTGSGPGELYLGQDKGLAKKIFAFEKILYPDFAIFSNDAGLETGGNLRMPLFVKPLRADASIGITGDSLVRDATALMKRVIMIHEKLNDSALVEEYIEGREIYVGVVGNGDPVPLPPMEMDFSGMPEGMPHIVDSKAKWSKRSAEYKGTKSVLPELPDDLRARLQKVAVEAYRALRVRDYGRVDLRLTETGEIYVIEVNASCYLEKESEFATAAAAHGMDFTALVNHIAELAVERYKNGRP
jgi:D-alanine-D-alanine ligase